MKKEKPVVKKTQRDDAKKKKKIPWNNPWIERCSVLYSWSKQQQGQRGCSVCLDSGVCVTAIVPSMFDLMWNHTHVLRGLENNRWKTNVLIHRG